MGRFLAKVFLYLTLLFSFSTHARGQGLTQEDIDRGYVEGEIIVRLKENRQSQPQSFLSKSISQNGLILRNSWARFGAYHFATKPGQSVMQAVHELQNDPDVEFAEPNYIVSKSTTSEGFGDIMSLEDVHMMGGGGGGGPGYLATDAPIQVTDTWGTIASGSEVPIVAVIDTGVDINHPVFTDTDSIWINPGEIPDNGIDDDSNGFIDDVYGWNFVSNSKTMLDDDGHGTHVAGTILGVNLNIYSSTPGTAQFKIMPLKFLDGSGFGKTSDAIKAIYYAVNNGAHVLNNSWGGPSYSAALHEAVAYSFNKGTSFVAAAGNSSSNNDFTPMYPASYNVPNVISVAATNDVDNFASFSNFGPSTVHLASPGVLIYSTIPGAAFGNSSGTSMAAPFIAGVVTMMKLAQPDMLGYQMKQIVMGSSDGVSILNGKVYSKGRLNALTALTMAQSASIEGLPSYTLSNQDRALASSLAAGGCGMVGKLVNDTRKGPSGGGGGMGSPMMTLFVILLALPMVIYQVLRSRNGKNKRKHERFKIDTEVKVQLGERELVGSISTISVGGVQLNTNALIEQGGVVSMSIRSPDGKEEIKVEGQVVWSESKKAYGVAFKKAPESAQEQIKLWTQGLSKAS